MSKKLLYLVVGLVAFLFCLGGVVYVATSPEPPTPESASARWLKSGSYRVSQRDYVFVDEQRPTSSNKEYQGDSHRTLKTTIWYPKSDQESHPLVIYSHGFMSSRTGGSYLTEYLASHGYVVASADFPLTNFSAPGGPNASDVSNQPADVSYVIDSILALEEKPFGDIDEDRIGAMGLSLGGLTTTLVTFHPGKRDDRIKAAVSIAGPANMFTKRFFDTVNTPFLMIAGTIDAIVNYESNARTIPERAVSGRLLTIKGASHTSFASVAEPLMRGMNNPDVLGCDAVLQNLGTEPVGNRFAALGGEEEGIVFPEESTLCINSPLPESLHPGRQHMITQVGVLSFFESVFAKDPTEKEAAGIQLATNLARDFAEVSFSH